MQAVKDPPVLFQVPLFKDLSVMEKEALFLETSEAKFKKGEFIIFPGKEITHLNVLVSGVVKTGVYDEEGKEVIQSIVYPEKLFGELALISAEESKEFAQALTTEVTVLQIPLATVREMVLKNSASSFKYIELVSARLKRAEKRLQSMVFQNARGRIVDFIKDLAETTGKKIGYETLIHNYLTHMEIANLTATSRQTVTTVLNDLRAKNQIYFDRRRILIRDLATLA